MAEQEVVLRLDRDSESLLGAAAARYGLPVEEFARLLLERALDEGVDRILSEEMGRLHES